MQIVDEKTFAIPLVPALTILGSALVFVAGLLGKLRKHLWPSKETSPRSDSHYQTDGQLRTKESGSTKCETVTRQSNSQTPMKFVVN